MRSPLIALALSTLALALQGCPSCPYEEACDGDTLLYCYLGVDQLVGDPEEGERACEAPNPVCITVSDDHALCGIDEARTCADAEPRCEGDLLVTCNLGFEVGEACNLDGNACSEVDGKSACREAPLVACDADFVPECVGDVRRTCADGYVVKEDCARAGQTCQTSTNDYGTSAYCAG